MRLKKNSSTSSKPPSSDIVKPPEPSPPDRKQKCSLGGQPGHAQHTRTPFGPEEVDQIIEYGLKAMDTEGLRPLNHWYVVQQVKLVKKPFVVTEHRARQYAERRTGEIVTAPLPPEIGAAGLVGPRLSATIAFQKAACHMSYSTIQNFWQDLAGLHLCRGQPYRTSDSSCGYRPPRDAGNSWRGGNAMVRAGLDNHGDMRPTRPLGLRVSASVALGLLHQPTSALPATSTPVNGYQWRKRNALGHGNYGS